MGLISLFHQSPDKTILYAVACTLVNCTNSYEKKDILPELIQLAKFSKQHVPEQHPKVNQASHNPLLKKTAFWKRAFRVIGS